MWIVIHIMIFSQKADACTFLSPLCTVHILILATKSWSINSVICSEKSDIYLFFQWKSSQGRALKSLRLLQTIGGSSCTQHSLSCWDVRACSIENALLMSFTVTSCMYGRGHHPHFSHGNGICLLKRMWITSSHAFLFDSPLSFTYCNF